jgi:hypothetical protein
MIVTQKYKPIEIGDRIGRLIVIEIENEKRKYKKYHLCKCDCGNIVTVSDHSLKTKKTKSCGCLHLELIKNHTKHGECRSPQEGGQSRLYSIYRKILYRCYNVKSKCYNSYGGRGIIMCDEWKQSFPRFKEWALTHGYKESIKNLTVDRIDNNGIYEPSNCQFLTNSENVKKQWAELRASGRRNYVKEVSNAVS